MKKLLLLCAMFLALSFNSAQAQSGCCSWHGGVCGCGCCDGTSLSATCAPYYPNCNGGSSITTYSCSKYGVMAYVEGSSCKCMSGYIMGKNALGNSYCVSGYSYCNSKYGYNSTYNSLSNGCDCSSGYVLQNGTCVKQKTNTESCHDDLGVMSIYNSVSNTCDCFAGYVIGKDIFGKNQCIAGNTYCSNQLGLGSQYNSSANKCECRSGYDLTSSSNGYTCQSCLSKYGFYSSYSYLNKKCECNAGYTLSNNQCVKKVSSNNGSVLSGTTDNIKNIIPEGSMIKTKDNPDIYIVKYIGDKRFKRLILSPSVFKTYSHLKWENIRQVDQNTLDLFTTSSLVRSVGDTKVYMLYPQGDTGNKRQLKDNSIFSKMNLDQDSIYEINSFDRDSYITGATLN